VSEVTEAPVAARGWWSRVPAWARVGLIALLTVVVALAGLLAFRLLTRAAPIPLGVTAVGDLRPGSCLAEAARDLAEYTVVPCGQPHPQEVFATAELEVDDLVYAQTGGALQSFGDELCDRYREYKLFLVAGIDKNDYAAYAIDLPNPEQYAGGDTEALCVIAAEDGSDITGDVYRQMP
jgi:hypothetical protein